jgi:carbamoyltransferase
LATDIQTRAIKKAWFHVDMDGLDAIYKGQGLVYRRERDDFYVSAVENSLIFFQEQGITATYFLIAQDLDDPAKRRAVDSLLRAGHNIACHGLRHRYLNQVSLAEKQEEIVSGKAKIENTLGVACLGFRASGYSLDYESLELLCKAGFKYDSSVFPNYEYRKRLGIQRLFPEPFLLSPEDGFFEIPLPYVGPGLLPFHPCYSFYLTRFYYRTLLHAFQKRNNYLTLLFHLTDFATPQRLGHGFRLNILTNNYFSKEGKLSFLRKLMAPVRKEFGFTTTEDFIRQWPHSAPDLNPKTILGVSTTHETGACVVQDGRLLAATNEERLSRRKLDNSYPPIQSIREVIRIAKVRPEEIEAVAIAGLHWKDLLPQTWEGFWTDVRDFHAWNDYFPHFCRVLYRLFYFWRATQYGEVAKFLKQEYGVTPKVYYVEHHEAHAASVYRMGDRDDALIVTADGVGDDLCITFSKGSGAQIRRAESFFYPNSFGQFYTACTQILGFKAGRHEGKITGLSGYGKPNPELISAVEKTFFAEDGFRLNKRYYSEGFLRLHLADLKRLLRGKIDLLSVEYRNYKKPLKRLVQGRPREEVAYAFQFLLEREMVRLTRRHTEGKRVHLTLAGGVFANVKLNRAMSQELAPESVFIFPNMGDGGLCVGAALTIAAPNPAPVSNMYLGAEFTEPEILQSLGKSPTLRFEKPQDMARMVAAELAKHRIVARFDGRMEFGPRALGNRSILYQCGDRSVNDWLNHQLRRTEFMPFAPICLWEDADEYFEIREGERRACEFMTLVVMCTEKMKQTCPAAVHVDGTARPQLVRREINPGMYGILAAYKELTGISCLINTSFNMHEEPIVRSPHDAISAFRQSKIDLLILGPYLVWEEGSDYDRSRSGETAEQQGSAVKRLHPEEALLK